MNLISFNIFYIILFDRVTNIVTYNISLSGYVIQSPEKTFKKNLLFFTNYWINSNQFIKVTNKLCLSNARFGTQKT